MLLGCEFEPHVRHKDYLIKKRRRNTMLRTGVKKTIMVSNLMELTLWQEGRRKANQINKQPEEKVDK